MKESIHSAVETFHPGGYLFWGIAAIFVVVLILALIQGVMTIASTFANIRQKDRELEVTSRFVSHQTPTTQGTMVPVVATPVTSNNKNTLITILLTINALLMGVLVGALALLF